MKLLDEGNNLILFKSTQSHIYDNLWPVDKSPTISPTIYFCDKSLNNKTHYYVPKREEVESQHVISIHC